MKSLERRFKRIAERNLYWSSYLCFAEAVNRQEFITSTVHRWFHKLVDKDDYARGDKRTVLEHLDKLSTSLRTTEIRGKPDL